MATYTFKMPDIGEGIVEAEIVEWYVQPGDTIAEDALLAAVMTDKATVEITSPVAGRVTSIGGQAGEKIVIGADLVNFDVDDALASSTGATATHAPRETESPSDPADATTSASVNPQERDLATENTETPSVPVQSAAIQTSAPAAVIAAKTPVAINYRVEKTEKARKLASPAVRRRARELGMDVNTINGTGPKGRVLHHDLQNTDLQQSDLQQPDTPPAALAPATANQEIALTGLRRVIARRLQSAKRSIPHFTYVEEVDVTELENLRQHLNEQQSLPQIKLSLLHFIVVATCGIVRDWPQCNAHYDSDSEILTQFGAVHPGIATMTDDGLMVPVIRDAQTLGLWEIAAEINRLAAGARDKTLTRDELSGSTLTISSLGPLAGIAATPIINQPETCIICPNKMRDQLTLQAGRVVTRKVMNLSSSFDHRVVDGYHAAEMIQKLKYRLEHPATIFIDSPPVT